MDQFTISVKIAERVYRMKIRPEEEEGIRKAAKLINEKVKDYSNTYAFNDYQDLLSMVALQFAVRYVKSGDDESKIDEDLGERLEKINNYLTEKI